VSGRRVRHSRRGGIRCLDARTQATRSTSTVAVLFSLASTRVSHMRSLCKYIFLLVTRVSYIHEPIVSYFHRWREGGSNTNSTLITACRDITWREDQTPGRCPFHKQEGCHVIRQTSQPLLARPLSLLFPVTVTTFLSQCSSPQYFAHILQPDLRTQLAPDAL